MKAHTLTIIPMFQKPAFAFIEAHHRHHKKPVGSVFQIGVRSETGLHGVAVVGRPVAPKTQNSQPLTWEVTRLCTDGTPNACSMLYSACWRICREMGVTRLITFILDTESGISLNASGWKLIGQRGGLSWNVPSRPRIDKHPIQMKLLYEKTNTP